MPKHLMLPKNAYKDVKPFLQLDAEQLRALATLFATAESVSATDSGFLQKVSERLRLPRPAAESVVLVCQFFLTVAQDGHSASEILDDVREFVAQTAPSQDKELVAALDTNRALFEELLTPTSQRLAALKVRYLRDVYPRATKFRTVCELRPVFDQVEGEERIKGYVPAIILEATQPTADDEGESVLLHLSPDGLKSLSAAIARAEDKLAAIRREFGDKLLGETTKE